MNYTTNKFLALLAAFIRILFILLAIATIIGMLAPQISGHSTYKYLAPIVKVERTINIQVKGFLPTFFFGTDLSRWMTLAGALFLSSFFNNMRNSYAYKASFLQAQSEAKTLHKIKKSVGTGTSPAPASKELVQLDEKLHEIETAKRSDRRKLLSEFVALKTQLESMGRDMAFLSIDVVDSTGMKQGEDQYVVADDFLKYRDFIEKILAANGAVKTTWTPDGIMTCFDKLEDAIKAAQTCISDLDDFNKNIKTMKRDFHIRCGINSGYIFFDDSLPLEQISDRIIDIAGHMQKHARPDTITIAKAVVQPVVNVAGFSEADLNIDGLDVFEWKK